MNMSKLTKLLDRVYGEVETIQELADDALDEDWKAKNWKRLKYVLLVNYCGIEDVKKVVNTLSKLYPKLGFKVKQSKKRYKIPDVKLSYDDRGYEAPLIVITCDGPVDIVDKVHDALRGGFGTGAERSKRNNKLATVIQDKNVQSAIFNEYHALATEQRKAREAERAEEERKRREAEKRARLVKNLNAVAAERKSFKKAAEAFRSERIAKANEIRKATKERHAAFLASRRRVQTA